MKNKNYTYPISITLNKSDGFVTKDLIIEKFKNAIKDYYNIDHDVNFYDIKKSVYNYSNDSVVLDYTFSNGEIPEIKSSIHNTMLDMCMNTHFELKDFDFDSLISNIQNGKTNYIDLTELQSVYLGMKYDEYRENSKNNDWNIIGHIIKNKLKGLFSNKRDGSYHEVKLVDFKLEKLLKFNKNKHDFVQKRLKRKGKTLTNFVSSSKEWDNSNRIKLNLDKTKHSMELRTDLALSGLNDDIV